jgi:hypothetical protein
MSGMTDRRSSPRLSNMVCVRRELTDHLTLTLLLTSFRTRTLNSESQPWVWLHVQKCHASHLKSERALIFANHICHRTDRPTQGGVRTTHGHRGTDHYAVPISSLQRLEASATHIVLANRAVKLVAANLSLTPPLIASDLTDCLSGRFPVFEVGDLNAKHPDWISRLTTARDSLVRDNANRTSGLTNGPDSPTTVPLLTQCEPWVLYIAMGKDFVLPEHLTFLSTYHVSNNFSKPTEPPRLHANGLRRFPGLTCDRLPGNTAVNNEKAIDKRV